MQKAIGPGGVSLRLPTRRLCNSPRVGTAAGRRRTGEFVSRASVTAQLIVHYPTVNKRSLLKEWDCLTFPLDQAL